MDTTKERIWLGFRINLSEQCFTIVNRPRNGHETVGNIKVVSTDSFKQLEVAIKVDYVSN